MGNPPLPESTAQGAPGPSAAGLGSTRATLTPLPAKGRRAAAEHRRGATTETSPPTKLVNPAPRPTLTEATGAALHPHRGEERLRT